MKPFFQIATNNRTADIYIYGDICEWAYEDLGEQSAVTLSNQIKDLDVDEINVHIDSYGGEIKEAWGMFNALRNHKAKINTFADGFVASAALFPFLAGDNRYASSVSAFYLHKVLGGGYGYADDLRKAADDIDFMTDTGVNAFVEVAGMDRETVEKLMADETWLTADQALEHGIVTAITKAEKSKTATQSARTAIVQKIFAEAINTPEEVHKDEPKKNKLKEFFERI